MNERALMPKLDYVGAKPVTKDAQKTAGLVMVARENDRVSNSSVENTARDDTVLTIKSRSIAMATMKDLRNRGIFENGTERWKGSPRAQKMMASDVDVVNKGETTVANLNRINGGLKKSGMTVRRTELIAFEIDGNAEARIRMETLVK